MDNRNYKHRLAALLSADVVGYSRLMAADELGTIRTLSAYRAEVTALDAHPQKPDRGNVRMQVRVLNQHDEEVQTGDFTVVMPRLKDAPMA